MKPEQKSKFEKPVKISGEKVLGEGMAGKTGAKVKSHNQQMQDRLKEMGFKGGKWKK